MSADAFAGKRVGLRLNADGRTELHFANVHLGHLVFDAEGGRFRPAAYVAPVAPRRPDPNGRQAAVSAGEGASSLPRTPPLI